MGICFINENFEELQLNYFESERAKEAKMNEDKKNYTKIQQIITVNKFQLEKLKKDKILKKKTHEKNNNLGIHKNDDVLLLSLKKEKSKTESACLSESRVSASGALNSKRYDIANYPKDVLELINKIRTNPQSFVIEVENAIKNIQSTNNKIIYNGKLKINLHIGENMFKEAINFLKETKPMKPLMFNKNLEIELPSDEEFKNDNDYFKKQILSQKNIKKIERYYREAIKDPYIGVLMMIVDDTIKNQGAKRITILDPSLSSICINCKMYGKKFLAYLTFSK